MTSSKKLLYQSIPLVMDNFCTKFHDVTISSAKVIEGGEGSPPTLPRIFYLQKSPVLLGLNCNAKITSSFPNSSQDVLISQNVFISMHCYLSSLYWIKPLIIPKPIISIKNIKRL